MKTKLTLFVVIIAATFSGAGCASPKFPQFSKEFNKAYEKYGEPVKIEPVYIRAYGNNFLDKKRFYFRSESNKHIIVEEDARVRPMNINRP